MPLSVKYAKNILANLAWLVIGRKRKGMIDRDHAIEYRAISANCLRDPKIFV
jgi:hypothetical protein